jgi:RND family efflux transporter MFP subunit
MPVLRACHSRKGGILGGLLICLVLVGVVGAVGYKMFRDSRERISADQLVTEVARRGPFDHIVLEQGEIESSSNKEVISEVKSRGSGGGTAILWVIDEGTKVKKGDKLVELDSSELELRLKEQKIQVITENARVATAKALVEQAVISKQEYLEGVFMTEEKSLLSEEAIANQNLQKAELALQSSVRLVGKGLMKSLQLEADKYALVNAQNQVDAARGKLRVLRNLTKQKMLVQFVSDIEAAEASLSAANAELLEEQAELDEIEDQIKRCLITAPSDGVVVHANRYSSRGGNAEFVVEAGATVRERQEIIRLPDPSMMQVKCKINESRITLIREGMPAKITVDAIPGMNLTGQVMKVNRYAEPSSFFSSSIKEYATIIEIIDPPDNIRTGMTAEVQIFVEQIEDALQIPIQGLYEHGNDMYTLIQKGPQSFETTKVEIGATNDTMASIADGITENDKIILNLRQHLSLMELPEVVREDNSNMREIAAQFNAGQGSPAMAKPQGVPEGGRMQGRPGSGQGRPGGRPGGAGGNPGAAKWGGAGGKAAGMSGPTKSNYGAGRPKGGAAGAGQGGTGGRGVDGASRSGGRPEGRPGGGRPGGGGAGRGEGR